MPRDPHGRFARGLSVVLCERDCLALEDGLTTVAAVARRLGRPRECVRRAAIRQRVHTPQRVLAGDPLFRREAARLWRRGLQLWRIAQRLGCSEMPVKKALYGMGLYRRPKARRRVG